MQKAQLDYEGPTPPDEEQRWSGLATWRWPILLLFLVLILIFGFSIMLIMLRFVAHGD
jgi:hypothetical protein